MSKIVPLIAFGFGLVTIGATWSLFDSVREYFNSFIIESSYYTLQLAIFRWMPLICILVGVFCLIAAGVVAAQVKYTEEY